jgi:hypothetical protein
MKLAGLCAVFLSLLVVGACGKAASRATSGVHEAPALVATAAASPGAPSADRAMRITVDTTIVVKHRDAAVTSLRALVKAAGGFVSEGTVSGSDDGGSAKFSVKVPAAEVGEFRTRLHDLGDVRSDTEKAEDVTEARADLKARLHNARASEQRLLDLMSGRTGTLADVVAVEKELSSVREAIERLEAEDRTLEGQIAFATVTVSLETVYAPSPPGAGQRIAEAARDGLSNAHDFVLGVAVAALWAGPTLLLIMAGGGLFAYLLHRLSKRFGKKRGG